MHRFFRRALLSSLFAMIASGLTGQRLVHAVHDDDSVNLSSAIGWPSSTVAMQVVPSTSFLCVAAEVFTGNGVGTNQLTLWSHDAATNMPLAPLAPSGAFTMLAARCWQGAVFPVPVQLQANTKYWLVWDVVNFTQNSVSGSGAVADVEVRVSSNGGASWHASVLWPAKLRLYEPAPAGAVTIFGVGKQGGRGVPSIGVSGWPAVGNSLDVWLDGAEVQATCVLLIGTQANIPLPIATAYVDPVVLLFQTATLGTTPSLRGTAAYTFRVPVVPGAVGFGLSFQWGIFDAAAVGGLAHTQGATALLL
jgi:hypothetical protein